MVATTHRPAPLPQQQAGKSSPRTVLPSGAAKMQAWYIDDEGKRRRMPYEVPVDADDHRTGHLRFGCPATNTSDVSKGTCPHFEWLIQGAERYCPQHGKQLVPPKEGSRLLAVALDAYRMYGRSAAPWALPAAALAADAGMSLADVSAGQVLPAVPMLAAGAYVVTKRALTRRAITRGRIERGQRTGRRIRELNRRARRAAAVAAESGLWLTALSGTDLTTWAGRIVAAAGMVRWAVGVRPWWQAAERRRTRDVTPAPVTAPVPEGAEQPPVEPPDPVQLAALVTWATRIGCPGGPLAGTELVEYTRLPACEVGAAGRTRLPNWSAKVVAKVAGTINMRENRPTLLGRIAAAYGCTYADVAFTADESDLSIGWLRVQPDNLLAETKLWPGPNIANDWKRGRSRIGRFDDGRNIWYQWWTGTGSAHDLISGCTGSGKSELVAQLLLAGSHSDGLVLDWVGDPQGGQSYGALKDAVDWFARDKSEITLMLLAALKEMLRRNDELSEQNIKTWQATKAMPLLVITLDEVQSYIDDPIILELVEKLVGQGRKCGIKMRLITQIPAAYNLGGSTYIKEQLKAGQTVIFRAMTDVAGRSAVDGDCPVDPTELPSIWGKHTCAAGQTTAGLLFIQGVNGRDVYGRADWTGEDMAVWLTDTHGASTLRQGTFGRDAQAVSGVLWGERKERARRLLEMGRSDEDLLSGGKAVELIEAAAALTSSNVATSGPRESKPANVKPGEPKARDVLLTAILVVVDERGLVERDAIIAATPEMKEGTRNRALTDLVSDGALRRVRNGLYEVPFVADLGTVR